MQLKQIIFLYLTGWSACQSCYSAFAARNCNNQYKCCDRYGDCASSLSDCYIYMAGHCEYKDEYCDYCCLRTTQDHYCGEKQQCSGLDILGGGGEGGGITPVGAAFLALYIIYLVALFGMAGYGFYLHNKNVRLSEEIYSRSLQFQQGGMIVGGVIQTIQ